MLSRLFVMAAGLLAAPLPTAAKPLDTPLAAEGPFTFHPSDFASDESNLTTRCGAALALFQRLENRHGAAAVRAWLVDVLATKDASPV